jgi:cell division protein FtsB
VNAMLLNEFLKQHRSVEEQKAQIQSLEQQNNSLAQRLHELEATVKSLAEKR